MLQFFGPTLSARTMHLTLHGQNGSEREKEKTLTNHLNNNRKEKTKFSANKTAKCSPKSFIRRRQRQKRENGEGALNTNTELHWLTRADQPLVVAVAGLSASRCHASLVVIRRRIGINRIMNAFNHSPGSHCIRLLAGWEPVKCHRQTNTQTTQTFTSGREADKNQHNNGCCCSQPVNSTCYGEVSRFRQCQTTRIHNGRLLEGEEEKKEGKY